MQNFSSFIQKQILIVNFGGIVFAVEKLDWDHWMWCMFVGFGSLLWGQVSYYYEN